MHTTDGGGDLYAWFNNPNVKASAHYGVLLSGVVEQYVKEGDMAWHAGTNAENGLPNNNWETIGIEHQDNGNEWDSIRTPELYEAAAQLLADICKRYNIPCRLLSREEKWGSGIALHNYYANKTCSAGLDVNRIILRANQIMSSQTNPNNNMEAIYVAVEGGDGYSNIAKRAGWPYWDEAERVINELRSLNPAHPSFARGNHLWATDPAFIVGYREVPQSAPAPTPEPTPTPAEDLVEEVEAHQEKSKELAEKVGTEIAEKVVEKKQLEQTIDKLRTLNVALSQLEITDDEKEVVKKSSIGLQKKVVVWITAPIQKLPSEFRPLVYLGVGLLFSALAIMSDVGYWQQMVAEGNIPTLLATIGTAVTTGNYMSYFLKQLGDRFRAQAVEPA